MIDVSIIIINFNSFDLVSQTVTTFKKFAEGFTYEIIVIDNASKDDSLKKLKSTFPEFRFIENDRNLGFGKANNQGLKIAKGEFVIFLNNDIIFIENSILKLLDFLRSKREKILVAPQLLNADGTVQYSTYSFQTLWLTFTTSFFIYALFPKSKYFNKYYLMNQKEYSVKEVDTITGAFIMGKKKHIDEINGFDEYFFFFGEDNDLCKRFRENGGKVIYYPETKVIHLKGGSSTIQGNWFTEKNHAIAYLKLFKRYYVFPKRILAYLFHYSGIFLRVSLLFLKYIFTFNKNTLNDLKLKTKTLLIFPWQI